MHRGYLRFGDTELVNHARLFAYFNAGLVPPGDFAVLDQDYWPWTARWLDDPAYRSPRLDRAPWYTPGVASSGEFLGLHLRSYTGIDESGWSREAVESIADGGAHGLGRHTIKSIELKLTAYATTHAGLMHGMAWVQDTLLRPVCDDRDATVDLRYLTAVPTVAAGIEPSRAMLEDCTDPLRRVLHDVAATTGITVDRWWVPDHINDSSEHMAADFTVTIAAADPHPYSELPVDLAGPLTWASAERQAVRWKVAHFGVCSDGSAPTVLTDPRAPASTATILRRPRPRPTNRICLPLYYRTVAADITVVAEGVGETTLTTTISAGSTELRNVTVRFRDLTSDRVIGEVGVSYLPAGAVLSIDGTTGRATALLADGTTVDASPVVSSGSLGPLTAVVLSCRRAYRVEATAPDTISATASVSVLGTTRWVG